MKKPPITISVSKEAREELRRRAKEEDRTMLVVIDRLLGVKRKTK